MSVGPLFLEGQKLSLGARIGRGGEGEVYEIDGNPTAVLKRYTIPNPKIREAKIRAIVNLGLTNSSNAVSYPGAIVTDETQNFVGFLMRRVEGHVPLHELYGPADRKRKFPNADFKFLVHAALNVVRAVGEVHRAGCVIGDINHSGILISPRGTATLIDADSFQYNAGGQVFLCEVGVPEYTPPELQGQPFTGKERTTDHDAFGLAVIIFQLLFMGRHPFSGRYDGPGEMPLVKAISEFRFAYSKERNTGLKPPPGIYTLDTIPLHLAALFEAAFSQRNVGQRPNPRIWVRALQKFYSELKQCPKKTEHVYSGSISACLWCKLEAKFSGAVFFLPRTSRSDGPVYQRSGKQTKFALEEFQSEFRSVRIPKQITHSLNMYRMPPAAHNIAPIDQKKIQASKALYKTLGVSVFLFSLFLLNQFGAVAGLIGFSVSVFVYNIESDERVTEFKQDLASIDKKIYSKIELIQNSINTGNLKKLDLKIDSMIAQYEHLRVDYKNSKTNIESEAKKVQLENFLDSKLIKNHQISLVSTSTIASLNSYGFESAKDILFGEVLSVQGVGEKKGGNLKNWAENVKKEFSFDTSIISDQIKRKRQVIQQDAANLRNEMIEKFEEYKELEKQFSEKITTMDTFLNNLLIERQQIVANLAHLGVMIDKIMPKPPSRHI